MAAVAVVDHDYFPPVIRFIDYDGKVALAAGAVATYEVVYGAENPWCRWLRKHAPALLDLTPTELRRYMMSNSYKGPVGWAGRAA